jgi:hypothetical protein
MQCARVGFAGTGAPCVISISKLRGILEFTLLGVPLGL